MYKHTVIKTHANDNADYEWMYVNAMENSIANYWEWAKENNVTDLHFEYEWNDNNSYGLDFIVSAVLDTQESSALFKLSFGNQPYTKLVSNNIENLHYDYA